MRLSILSITNGVKIIGTFQGNFVDFFIYLIFLEKKTANNHFRVLPEQNDETGFCALCKKLAELSQMSAEVRSTNAALVTNVHFLEPNCISEVLPISARVAFSWNVQG